MFLAVLALATALPHVVQVVSAHHGVCPAASNRVYSERAEKLFSLPLKLVQTQGHAQPERWLLHNARALTAITRRHPLDLVFVTFGKARVVRFSDSYVMHVRTFGVSWSETSRFATLYFGESGWFGVDVAPNDLRQLWVGECPTR